MRFPDVHSDTSSKTGLKEKYQLTTPNSIRHRPHHTPQRTTSSRQSSCQPPRQPSQQPPHPSHRRTRRPHHIRRPNLAPPQPRRRRHRPVRNRHGYRCHSGDRNGREPRNLHVVERTGEDAEDAAEDRLPDFHEVGDGFGVAGGEVGERDVREGGLGEGQFEGGEVGKGEFRGGEIEGREFWEGEVGEGELGDGDVRERELGERKIANGG